MVSNIETMQPRHQGQLRRRMRDLMERQEGELSTIPYVYSFASVFFSELWRSFGLTAVYGEEGGARPPAQKKYVLTQIEELISILERITGKKFDPDKLAEHEAHSNRMADLWTAIHRINREIPAVYDATLDGMNMQAVYIGWRGTRGGAEYLEVALRELEERRELGIMPLPQERFRLILDGVPPWPSPRRWGQL